MTSVEEKFHSRNMETDDINPKYMTFKLILYKVLKKNTQPMNLKKKKEILHVIHLIISIL